MDDSSELDSLTELVSLSVSVSPLIILSMSCCMDSVVGVDCEDWSSSSTELDELDEEDRISARLMIGVWSYCMSSSYEESSELEESSEKCLDASSALFINDGIPAGPPASHYTSALTYTSEMKKHVVCDVCTTYVEFLRKVYVHVLNMVTGVMEFSKIFSV